MQKQIYYTNVQDLKNIRFMRIAWEYSIIGLIG